MGFSCVLCSFPAVSQKEAEAVPDVLIRRQRRLQCHSDLLHLLQKLQGLPPTIPTLPLELSVVYNMVIIHSNLNGSGFLAEHSVQVEDALRRAVEALGQGDAVGAGLWGRILAAAGSLEMTSALHRLAGLRCALWMSSGRLHEAAELFSLLAPTPNLQKRSHKEDDLLPLIRAWAAPPEEPETIRTVQTSSHVKAVLYNAASLLQGITAMNAADFPQSVVFLQEAASSLCSSQVLAEIYTCLGCSFYKMAKPQVSLQYWRLALRTDFQCLSALHHSAVLYRHMGDAESELEALALLHTALEDTHADDSSRKMSFLLRTELIVSSSALASFIRCPASYEVKYLMARLCLQNRRIQDAVGHYLELMSVLQDGCQRQGVCSSPAPLPRVPVIYLEAAAALLEDKRFQDAVTVCSELLDSLGHITTGVISVDVLWSDREKAESVSEQLNCVLWASAAHLLQGEAHGRLGDHRASVADYTRSISLRSKVQGGDAGSVDIAEYKVLEILKSAALLGRGLQFQQMGEDVKALMNAQLGLQVAPAFPGVNSFMLDALWRLGRKKAAACQWRRFQSHKAEQHQEWEAIRGDLPLYLSVIGHKGYPMDTSLLEELEDYLQNEKATAPNDSFQALKT
ncbi:Fanconi anemia group G protein isoform X2 [Dendrobates tinctorius]|uniref:Fanconi anemia group G protein isoform X2 n=1 Tax=Dendrobates tinctorius TaxID=92724 RepID=UPI003CCA19E2